MVEEMYQQETKEEETDQEEEEQHQHGQEKEQIPMHDNNSNMATSAATTTTMPLSSVRSEFNANERDPSKNIINYRQYALGNQLVMLQSDDTTTASTSNHYFTAMDAVDLVNNSNAAASAAFGPQPAGDVSLTLGLRHSENVPRKPAQFQLRDFGAY